MYLPGTILRFLQMLALLMLITTPGDMCYYFPYFLDEKAEAREVKWPFQGLTANKS